MFSAPPVPRGVRTSVWNDSGGFRPPGSVEEERAEETGSTLLAMYAHPLNAAISRAADFTDCRKEREEDFDSLSLPWLRTCSRSPHTTNQILVTAAWTCGMPRGGHRDTMHQLLGGAAVAVCRGWSVCNRGCSVVLFPEPAGWRKASRGDVCDQSRST